MEGSEGTPRKSSPSSNQDQDHQATNGVNNVSKESSISNAMSASVSQNREEEKTTKINQRPSSKRKIKRKNKRRTKQNDSNDDKSNSTCLTSNGKDAKKNASSGRAYVSKRKRNGRVVRLVSIDSKSDNHEGATSTTTCTSKTTSVPPLPRNQYTTTLRRRAIRKLENNTTRIQDDELGDISLGIKLIVVGGRIIVQSLNVLADGLASPAQLAGVVQRGDVLLAIGNLSLINLPVDQLMEGLRPLSTPDARGYYERFLDLRFEAGAGLGLLKVHEEEQARSQNNVALQDPLTDAMFSLFPMVDQLSGATLFEPQYNMDTYRNEKVTENGDNDEDEVDIEEAKDKFPGDDEIISERKITDEVVDKFTKNFDSFISATLAKERNVDRERFESEYFDLREDFSELLRRTVSIAEDENSDEGKRLTKSERLELGKKIMQIAKMLELNMEEIDKGRDQRSHKNWSSGISLRSGSSASVRRRYNMDGTITSIRSGCDNPLEAATDEESVDSDGSLEEGVDADKLLLGLAARDAIWRKQVMYVLNKAIEDMIFFGEEKSKDHEPQNGGIDLTQQLGHFLFGENPSRISKLETKPFAFPPQEITQVLFDLATYITASAHDDITIFGASSKLSSNISSFRSGTTRTGGRGRAAVRTDILLAKRFILDEALPHWLKSFRPLKLEQRITLWPRQSNRTDSFSGTYNGTHYRSEYTGRSSDGDSLTLDSGGSRTQISSAQSRKKDLRELADQVTDHESQPET